MTGSPDPRRGRCTPKSPDPASPGSATGSLTDPALGPAHTHEPSAPALSTLHPRTRRVPPQDSWAPSTPHLSGHRAPRCCPLHGVPEPLPLGGRAALGESQDHGGVTSPVPQEEGKMPAQRLPWGHACLARTGHRAGRGTSGLVTGGAGLTYPRSIKAESRCLGPQEAALRMG